jgi:hypothetical protein
MKKLIILVVLITFIQTLGFSQSQKEKKVRIELKNGDVRNGTYKGQDENTIYIYDTDGNEVEFAKSSIKEMEYANEVNQLDFMDQYYFLSSNFPIGKGNSYYKNQNLFINQFNFGVSDNFSIGAGFESASLLLGGEFPPLSYVNPRISLGNDNIRFGLNAFFIFIPFDDVEMVGVLTPSLTIGSRTNNISFGIGTGFFDGEFAESFIATVAGTARISNKVSFIGELFIGSDFDTDIFSSNLGLRIRTGKIAIDAALNFTTEAEIAIPLLGLSIPF